MAWWNYKERQRLFGPALRLYETKPTPKLVARDNLGEFSSNALLGRLAACAWMRSYNLDSEGYPTYTLYGWSLVRGHLRGTTYKLDK